MKIRYFELVPGGRPRCQDRPYHGRFGLGTAGHLDVQYSYYAARQLMDLFSREIQPGQKYILEIDIP